MQGKCIIFSAPSGSGKTTIVNHLLNNTGLPLELSVSATTRKPRGQEVHGRDYYFYDPDTFRSKIANNEFVEWEEVYTDNYYGTLKSELNRIWDKGKFVVFDVDVNGGLSLKKIFGPQALAMFIKPPSIEVLEQRLRGRGTETEENIAKRMARAEFELSHAPKFDVCVVNDILEKSINEATEKINTFLGK